MYPTDVTKKYECKKQATVHEISIIVMKLRSKLVFKN